MFLYIKCSVFFLFHPVTVIFCHVLQVRSVVEALNKAVSYSKHLLSLEVVLLLVYRLIDTMSDSHFSLNFAIASLL